VPRDRADTSESAASAPSGQGASLAAWTT
jgi:hypothetical protein